MAARRSYPERPSFVYCGGETGSPPINPDQSQFEFDESEVWNSGEVAAVAGEAKKQAVPRKKPATARKGFTAAVVDRRPKAAASLPVNIPDWSKILRDECGKSRRQPCDDYDNDGDSDWVPPHEYLARNRTASFSFSVHEGVGRTLKGRDLSRVRNAIWKQTGFED
ncbi:hypothetical protein NMG60_11000561 [Bertholletia excelsa]